MTENPDRILAATARIVTAWLEANAIADTALPEVIRVVHRSLTSLDGHRFEDTIRPSQPRRPHRAVALDIQESVFPDHLVCLEDGKRVMMLKRHLRTAHGLTPELYRTKWGLPSNYPMVAPNYAKVRSSLAKASGLGRDGRARR